MLVKLRRHFLTSHGPKWTPEMETASASRTPELDSSFFRGHGPQRSKVLGKRAQLLYRFFRCVWEGK